MFQIRKSEIFRVNLYLTVLSAYVYGVVPISLCRAGGCGVSTSSSGGVKFDFDDDEEDARNALNGNHAPPISGKSVRAWI